LENGTPAVQNNQERVPILINASGFIRGALLVAAMEVGFYTLLVWLPNYAQVSLQYSHFRAHLSNTLALGCYIVAMLTGGLLSGYIPYKKILMVCLSLATILVYPLFAALLHAQSFALLLSVQCLLALLYGNICGVIMVILYDLFKDQGKNFGLAITFTLPAALFGGTAPLVCSYFVGHGHSLVFPAFYIALFGLLALPAAYGLKEEDQSFYADVAHGMRVIHQ
jgi:MHS family proline/betaine transporter-like MFS transporter